MVVSDSKGKSIGKKILIAGDWQFEIYEEAVANAFLQLGFNVSKFKWCQYFSEYAKKSYLHSLISRVQNKYMFGNLVRRLNKDFIQAVEVNLPHIIFIYRSSHLYPETLFFIKKKHPTIYLISYNNDDPFSSLYPWWKWRHFFKTIPICDLILSFRESNNSLYFKYGAKLVDLFRGYYVPLLHRQLQKREFENTEFPCDVIFVGHYEEDGRFEMVDSLANEGINIKIYGPNGATKKNGWGEVILNSEILKKQRIRYLKGEEYVKALNAAKIGLCFLSKLNNDTYTTRCFEIPACGTALFSEWSEDLEMIFENDVNAVLFRTKEELVEKVKYYLSHPIELAALTQRGKDLVSEKGHDIFSRVSSLVMQYKLLIE
jgi:spore maturation protein CgeB